jgi:hypothetical protein
MYKRNYDLLTLDKAINHIDQPESTHSLLQDLFPAHLVLERNAEVRMLSLLDTSIPRTLAQQRFTKNEWSLLTLLLNYHPHYVPHEVFLSGITLLSPDDCRRHLQKARLQGSNAIVQELKPVYRALSGVRTKLKKLYPEMKVSLIRSVGYALTLAPDDNDLGEL